VKKLLAFLLCSTLVLGDTSGPTSGTGAGTGWATVANVGASDNAYATRSVLGGDFSTSLSISALGFAIPASSTILGITATFEHKCSGASSCSTTTGSGGRIQLTKTAGTAQGTNKGTSTAWGTLDSTETLGSATDLWGSTWTVDEVNAAGFGMVVVVANANASSRTASVDYMALTITYSASGSGSHRRVVISQTRSVQIHG
jgi:hypothetical protein